MSSHDVKLVQSGDGLPGSFPEVITNQGPPELERASYRLQFSPSYAIVGIYRLATDKSLYRPAWDKCKHGTQRGLIVGFVWVRVFPAAAYGLRFIATK